MRSIFLALSLAAIASAQSPTTISDVVFVPSNSGLFQGRITISTDTPFEWNGQTYTRAWRQSVAVNNGIFTLTLPPNDATLPLGTSYVAEFEPASGGGYTERWVVPTTNASVTIAQIRTAVITIPGKPLSPVQISRAGANVGDLLRWNGFSWVPAPGTSVMPITLDQLFDVTTPFPTNGQFLRFDGAEWVPALITQSDVAGLVSALANKSPLGHLHAIADVTGLQAALDSKAIATHSHTIADIAALQAALDGKAPLTHIHAIANVTGLQTALDAKAAAIHSHVISDTTGLQAALDGKAAAIHTHPIADTVGLQSILDGKASILHVHTIADTTGLQVALDGKASASHAHAQADVTGLVAALAGKSAIGHVHLISDIATLQAILDAKAPLISPALTGTPTAPTQALSDNSTAIATTAWVKSQGYGTGGGGAADLNGLSDVTITSPASGQFVRYNGTGWENAAAQLADVTGLVSALAGKAASVHAHVITDVTGLQSALDAKAALAHTHAISDTTGLQAALDAKAALSHVHAIANVTGLQAALDLKSPLDSPTFTGTPAAPTPLTADNSTRLATTAWVRAQGYGAGGGATDIDALTDVTITSPVSGHVLKYNGANWANLPLGITDIPNLQNELDLKAPLASPALTGTPTAPTPLTADNSTRIATTAWVRAQGYGAGGGATNLDGLTDAVITSATTGQVLRFDGSNWVNSAIAQADVTGLVAALAGKAATTHGHIISDTTGLQGALDAKAPLASPALTGNPTAPTPLTADNSTAIATTAWVRAQGYGTGGGGGGSAIPPYPVTITAQTSVSVTAAVHGKGLNPVAYCYDNATNRRAVNADPTLSSTGTITLSFLPAFTGTCYISSFSEGYGATTLDGLTDAVITSATTGQVLRFDGSNWVNSAIAQADVTGLVAALAGKAATTHSHIISDTTGLQSALDAKAALAHTHAIADVTGLQAALDLEAPLNSPAFTGTPTVPTAAPGTNTTQAASTAFVTAAVAAGGGGGGSSTGIVSSGLLSQWRFDEASGTTVADTGTQACNGTIAANTGGSGLPLWNNGGLVFNGANRHSVQFAAGCFTSAVTIQVFLDALPVTTTANPSYFGYTGGVGGLQLSFKDPQYGTAALNYAVPTVANGSGAIIQAVSQPKFGPSMITTVLGNPGNIYWDLDLVSSAGNTAAATRTQAMQFGGSAGSGSQGWYTGAIYYAIAYNRALTALEVRQNFQAVRRILEARGVVLSPLQSTSLVPQVVCTGDSLTAGWQGTTVPCTAMTTEATTDKTPLSFPAQSASAMVNLRAWAESVYRPNTTNINLHWAGTNDAGSATPQATVNAIAAFARARKASGFHTIVGSIISRTGNTSGAANQTCGAGGLVWGSGSTQCTRDAWKNEINRLLRLQWPSFADGFADIAQLDGLGADGAFANPTAACAGSNCFGADGIHLLNAGYSQVALIQQRAVNRVLARSQASGNVGLSTYTATATLRDSDAAVLCDPTSASITLTAALALGATGHTWTAKNVQTSGANTCTISAAAGETINGAASITLANGESKTFASTGKNWITFN